MNEQNYEDEKQDNSVKRFYGAIEQYIRKNYIAPAFYEAKNIASFDKIEEYEGNEISSASQIPVCSAPRYKEEASPRQKKSSRPLTKKTTRSLDDVINQVDETFSERLIRLANERNLTNVEIYKRANIRRQLWSKIISNKDYQPKKNTAIVLALALHLNLDETRDFLSRAGYALSPSSKGDLIVQFFIENNYYDLQDIDQALYDHGEEPLSNYESKI